MGDIITGIHNVWQLGNRSKGKAVSAVSLDKKTTKWIGLVLSKAGLDWIVFT
jgi:hypothetical protein